MPTGIDVGGTTVFVVTPGGTTRHRNAVRLVDANDEDASALLADVAPELGHCAALDHGLAVR